MDLEEWWEENSPVEAWVDKYVERFHKPDLYPLNKDYLVGTITDAINAYEKHTAALRASDEEH